MMKNKTPVYWEQLRGLISYILIFITGILSTLAFQCFRNMYLIMSS